MQPSKYQEAIYEWVQTGEGHAFVEAVAGSGKTTTALEAAKLLPATTKAQFLAFNKSIAEELGGRLKGTPMAASTIHSLGYGALRRAAKFGRPDPTKYRAKAMDYIDYLVKNTEDEDFRVLLRDTNPVGALVALIDKVRVTLTDPRDTRAVSELVWRFGIEVDPDIMGFVLASVPKLLQTTVKATRGVIDFTDMIYLPVVDPAVTLTKFDWLFVDEAQDLSPCQMALVLGSCASTGRMLFVGDPKQAIYGFAGADAQAVPRIIEATDATVLPLSVCYRCPASHLEWARSIVPQIEARPGAPQGEIRGIDYSELAESVDPKREDLVVCRFNAPLVSATLNLLGQGIPAKMRGRDIGAALVAFVEKAGKFSKTRVTSENLDSVLDALVEHEVSRLLEHNRGDADDPRIAALHDKRESAVVVWRGHKCETVSDLKTAIAALFSDTSRGVVMLSSIHRAKGLEANHVFILQPEKMPRASKKAWEQEQEYNLLYVALTRSKQSLTFVLGDEDTQWTGHDDQYLARLEGLLDEAC